MVMSLSYSASSASKSAWLASACLSAAPAIDDADGDSVDMGTWLVKDGLAPSAAPAAVPVLLAAMV